MAAAFITFALGVLIFVIFRRPSQVSQPSSHETQLIIPKASWEPIFFKSINSVSNLTAQPELRKLSLREDEREARVWWGFGLSPLEGVSLGYRAGQWSAIHVKADDLLRANESDA